MAKSGTINGSATGSSAAAYSFWCAWQVNSQSTANNQSNVTFYLRVRRTDGNTGAYNTGTLPSVTLRIDGQTVSPQRNYIDTRNGATCTFATYTGNVSHSSDGSKKVSVSASFTVPGSSITSLTGGSLSGTAALDTIPRATTPTLSPASVVMGNRMVISLPRASSGFTHTLSYTFYRESGQIGTNIGTSVTWNVPLTLAQQVPNSVSGSGKITCITYSGGTQVGSTSVNFTAVVPENAQTEPEISVALSPEGSVPAAFKGRYIQGKTAVKADFSGTLAKYGASIRAYSITVDGKSKAGNVSDTLSRAGSVTVKATATDTRGFTSSISQNITVSGYIKPTLIPCEKEAAILCERCRADGTPDNSGTYLLVHAKRLFSKIDEEGEQKNFCSIRYRSKTKAAAAYGGWVTLLEKSSASDEVKKVIRSVVPSSAATYQVQLGVIDDMGEASEITFDIPTAQVTFHLKRGGNGAAFGKYAEKENTLELDEAWELSYKGEELTAQMKKLSPSVEEIENWTCVTFPSGLKLCWTHGTMKASTPKRLAGYYYSETLAVKYPVVFTSVLCRMCDGGPSSTVASIQRFGTTSMEEFTFILKALSEIKAEDNVSITYEIFVAGI